MADIINETEQIERIRRAVIKRGCNVTVGDIMSETGLRADQAKDGLDSLIQTHEGTMRVSENGELMYSFAGGCILRDQRSWWQRNKKAIMKFIKGLFKVIIMLVLVIYFVIYLLILIALLSSGRNNSRSNINISGIWFLFWGTGSSNPNYTGYKKDPLYTRVYNFVFGPEEEEIDPLEARTKCAQLIRAKNGVITVEDWVMISGQSRAKCESDLARYTAEFDGTAEITDDGTLVYVFEQMMTSTKLVKKEALPSAAWLTLEQPRPLSGNNEQNGGNGAVIGLNTFNLIMSFIIMYVLGSIVNQEPAYYDPEYYTGYSNTDQSYLIWLGIFPFIFSSLIFLVPLLRLPSNRRENRERRERSIRKAMLKAIFDKPETAKTKLALPAITNTTNQCMSRNYLDPAKPEEIQKALNDIIDEMDGRREFEGNDFVFERMDERLADARKERNKRALSEKALGRVVYSTDNKEQERINDENERADLEDFDRLLCGDSNQQASSRAQSIDSGHIMDSLKNISAVDYDSNYSANGPRDARNNHSQNMF